MSYIERIQNSIEYIHCNYSNVITLDDLAEKAFCSKYHYLRVFHALIGQSPVEYLRMYRLNKAAFLLSTTEITFIEIALECGFNSPIVFSRLFKDAFGVTPSSFKKNNIPLPIFKEIQLGNDKAFVESKNILLGPRFIDKKGFMVVGMQCKTTVESNLQNHVVEKLWQKFCPRINQIPYRIQYGESFGVNYFDSSINRYVYTACVEVGKVENIPKGMVSKVIPECKYAVFTIMEEQHKLLKNFYYSIDYIFGKWLPSSGFELCSEVDMLEFYDNRFCRSPYSQMDLFIPIC